ncbi:hypothetical protein [Spirosoma validum]|uniref:Uncharacterized protein n=1 Tax=Spirosoma validum TaxID=2771355 RepID=A0A927B227_9BACT|nr:hypothetical protein [Spirosoma validum]MBD2753807.1 hypothetical protein [Spirosoma validum]
MAEIIDRKQLLQENEAEQEISYTWLSRKVKPFGKAGQVSTRKKSPGSAPDWVASVMFAERVADSDQIKFTTFIVKDKEFEQQYQASQWMKGRLEEILKPAEV